jgi:hypothetical protein
MSASVAVTSQSFGDEYFPILTSRISFEQNTVAGKNRKNPLPAVIGGRCARNFAPPTTSYGKINQLIAKAAQ